MPQSQSRMSSSTPPVEQPLVPEGVFSVQLAQALKMGKVNDEAQAENMLSAVGIEPQNGWIADYPMTPDIVAEIEAGVAAAAEAKRIGLGKDEAQRALAGLMAQFGLNIQPGGPAQGAGEITEAAPPGEVVNNYYYDYGPPIVTYYPPPWEYYYLYAWVPFPFWFGEFFFDGFFVLHDFHRHIHFHHHGFVVTNHVFNRANNRVFVINPANRQSPSGSMAGRVFSTQAFRSPKVRAGARTILSRSRKRAPSGGFSDGAGTGRIAPSTYPRRGQGQYGASHRVNIPMRSHSGREGAGRTFEGRIPSGPQMPRSPRIYQPRSEFVAPQVEHRTFSPPPFGERSFSSPSPRVLSPPPASQGHVLFGAPARRGFSGFYRGGSSSRGFHGGGGSFGGFHRGGFHGGGFHGGGGYHGGGGRR